MSTPLVISACNQHNCLFNRSVLAYHGYYGFPVLDFPTPAPDNFFTNVDFYKKYLHEEVVFTTDGPNEVEPYGGTRLLDVDRLSGLLTDDRSGEGGYAGNNDTFPVFLTVISDDIGHTVRTTVAGPTLDGTIVTRTITLSNEYTDSRMYQDVDSLLDSASYLNPFGTYPEIRTTFYVQGTGSIGYDAISDVSTPTTAFYHRYASGSNFPTYYDLVTPFNPFNTPSYYYATNALFAMKFQSQVRTHYYIRENNTEELERETVLTYPLSDLDSTLYADVFLPTANDTSCTDSTTNACTSSLVEVLPPAFNASYYMLFKVLNKSGSCS